VFCIYVPKKSEKVAEQMKRWKMNVKKSLSASEETSKSKLGGVS
jgi:hypothetical protein